VSPGGPVFNFDQNRVVEPTPDFFDYELEELRDVSLKELLDQHVTGSERPLSPILNQRE
jgi:hypothetical protein